VRELEVLEAADGCVVEEEAGGDGMLEDGEDVRFVVSIV
jgi:hypothetical protein